LYYGKQNKKAIGGQNKSNAKRCSLLKSAMLRNQIKNSKKNLFAIDNINQRQCSLRFTNETTLNVFISAKKFVPKEIFFRRKVRNCELG
jgi:hypothetical protein